MSIVVTLRAGDSSTDLLAQRIQQDPLIESNFLIEGVPGLEMQVMRGDVLLPHTMSVPKARIVAYYGGEFVSRETIIDAAGAALKELSLKKSAQEAEDTPLQEWRGIEGTTYSA
jgi:hypothetical protein